MASNLSVLIDLNILLDVLQKRQPFYEASANLLAAVETGRITGYVAAHSLPTLFYLIKKDKGSAEAKSAITNLLQIIKISPVDQNTIEQALNLDYEDFEDAIQMMSAVQGKMNCLVTRNIKDYRPALLPVMQPVDLLATL
jgi:predicted nucleic acid-binding protein